MRAAIVAFALVIAAPARAAADPETERAMQTYFAGEQRGGLVLGGMAVAGIATSALLYADGGDLARGASYPLFVLGTAHLAAGAFVYLSSARRVRRFGERIAADDAGFRTAERARMAGVSRQLLALKITWVVLIAAGISTAVLAHDADRDVLAGAAIGIAGEAAATLAFDVVAARRAHRYRARLAPTVTTGTSRPLPAVVLRGAF